MKAIRYVTLIIGFIAAYGLAISAWIALVIFGAILAFVGFIFALVDEVFS